MQKYNMVIYIFSLCYWWTEKLGISVESLATRSDPALEVHKVTTLFTKLRKLKPERESVFLNQGRKK